MTDLQDLFARTTDRIEPYGAAAAALRAARRRRARRRGTSAGLVAATAVATVVVAVRIGTGGTDGSLPPPTGSPTVGATEVPRSAPSIDPSRIQPVWDPRGVEQLPVVDLGVPRVLDSLTPGDVTWPVAVLEDGDRALLVGADGARAELALPAGISEFRTVSLSPDGTRLAVVGVGGFFWRSLDGDWRRVDLDDRDQVTGEGIEVTWAPDSRSVVLRSWLAGVQVDLDSSRSQRLPHLREVSWGFAPDGRVMTTSLPGVREWVDDEVVAETRIGPLENLQRPIISDTSVAASRANVNRPDERRPDDFDGLIALDRKTLETRGFLRVPDEAAYYVDGDALTPAAWLDDDTLAFTVHPKDAAKTYLVTWDVESGVLSRISCWDSAFSAVFATGLLG